MIKKFAILLFFAAAGALPGALRADSQPSALERAAELASPAVVAVSGYVYGPSYVIEVVADEGSNAVGFNVREGARLERRVSAGTGFFISSDGYLATNWHVVDDPDAAYRVDTGDVVVSAEVVYADAERDLAVLRVPGSGYPAIPLASGLPGVGDPVIGIGNALGRYVDSASSGEVLSLDQDVIARDRHSEEELDGLIMTSARLYPGDSGGPLLNERGEAVGVNVAIVPREALSFSIPIGVLKGVIEGI